jgi:hypothetical protein
MKKLLLLLFSILISLSSYGEWINHSSDTDGNDFYLDYGTIKQHSGYNYAWEMADYIEPSPYGHLSIKVYKKYDCSLARYQILSFVYYKQSMGKGSPAGTENPSNSEWRYPSPGSVGAFTIEDVCKQK